MRIIAVKTLKAFWDIYQDSEIPLRIWYQRVRKLVWNNPNDVLKDFPDADIIGNNRIVFNIKRNSYRLIVMIRYNKNICFIRFIGTHKEYDRIINITEI